MCSAPLRSVLVHKPAHLPRSAATNFLLVFCETGVCCASHRTTTGGHDARSHAPVRSSSSHHARCGTAADHGGPSPLTRCGPTAKSCPNRHGVNSIQHDAQELSVLQSALQAQLQLLQKGLLHRDRAEKFKESRKGGQETEARGRPVARLHSGLPPCFILRAWPDLLRRSPEPRAPPGSFLPKSFTEDQSSGSPPTRCRNPVA